MDFLLLFVLLGAMIFGHRLLVAKQPGNTPYKIAMGLALGSAFFLFWVNGAVGIIGDSNNDANMMYFGVLAVAIVGSVMARFQPQRMVLAMLATAVAQALVAMIALIGDFGSSGPIWPQDILGVTALFAVLWLGSARLFQMAARKSGANRN
ncbi:MAG: hypothetical protein MUP90_03575 [Gammaproteobacteria bacterium]|nr:hypothetical protein [Gammaproteobacteria bacterium]